MRNITFIVLLLLAISAAAQSNDYTRWVNPFIGTGGHGHTFPGATVPFGMVQLSPDTRIDNWDGSSGYHYSDDIIYGFSHTHLSGTGIPDGCDILFMPTVGEPRFFAKEGDKSVNGYASEFSHANEKAEPGYYSVRLDDDGILAEVTATKRVGVHRYTFPKTDKANIVLDLMWRDKVLDSGFTITEPTMIEGYRKSSSWAKNQIVYFAAEFSRPFTSWHIENMPGRTPNAKTGKSRVVFTFDARDNQIVEVNVAISFLDPEGARKNFREETPAGKSFEEVRADARAAWNRELSKIEVSGGTPEQTTTFYTALYHTMIHPNVFNDVDGRYKGHDGKIHQLPGYERVNSQRVSSPHVSKGSTLPAPARNTAATQMRKPARKQGRNQAAANWPPANAGGSDHYTVFSLWDTFRAAHPLYTIIDQKRTVDFINTFIRIYEQGGRLPVWELWGEETDTMIGYHAVSVIADAMAKGIKGFDYEKAYRAAKHSAELDHFGLAAYKKRGYISMEDENESVSKTLEYAYNDWCIAQINSNQVVTRLSDSGKKWDPNLERAHADKVNKLKQEHSEYIRRSRHFENLFDSRTGFFRARKNGGFVEPFSPTEVNFGFTEGNSWQYSFFVPHDVTRLMTLMGGREKFVAKLDELFTTTDKLSGREQADLTGLIGQYAHGNEPSHHITYLYNYAGEPWKTQKYVRKIMDEFYKNAPDGLIGNEDCGQMSAWYVMSAGGFYPVNPGDGVYAFGTPLFPEMTYRLENGKAFSIRAKNVSAKSSYILNAKLNGAPYKKAFITHEDIMRGGVLEFTMDDTTVTTAFMEFPVSSNKIDFVAVPAIEGRRAFTEYIELRFSLLDPEATVWYTKDGTDPIKKGKLMFGVLPLYETTTVKVVAFNKKGKPSLPVEATFFKRPNNWTVKILSGYSTQYTGGGDDAIVDGIRGTVNFASGEWQGVQGKPYEAVIDLKRMTDVREVGASFLQVAGPWIWMPDRIEFEISNDGVNFTRVAEIKPGFPRREMTPTIKEFIQTITPAKARYVRVRAYNFGKIPSWHPGAGGDPWIFVDEIFIR